MSDVGGYLWLVPALPLAAAFVTAFLGPRVLRGQSHWPCLLALAGSFVCAAMALGAVVGATQEGGAAPPASVYYPWIQVGAPRTPHAVDVVMTLRADPLSAVMAAMVTFVSTLIAIYSVGYMRGDPGYPRFFAEVSLFVFAMTLLVLADNFLVLYFGWEGVGLCSYLLIGFWFTRPSAADAARKAFLVTRLGDIGLTLGILLFWRFSGYYFDFDSVFREVGRRHAEGAFDHGLLVTGCLLVFCGAVGKSAQFPLHVWLPDAMEGPTPVSALIHAATMVTAGVYLVARCTPLFALAPEAQLTVAGIGGFTALLAALIALTQNDLKRVLAYSTISQLGYMFLALGCAVAGAHGLVVLAVTAAMFHLFTHAFFKALLFLGAGSVMHAMGNVIDMRRFGGLRHILPQTHWTFLVGALALAGFPVLSGFWSKDEILAAALGASEAAAEPYRAVYWLLLLVGVATAGLTAFYTFRAYFLTFWGPLRVPPEAGAHGHPGHEEAHGHGHAAHAEAHPGGGVAHESPPVMTVPLWILALFALGVGAVVGPLTHDSFAHLLGQTSIFAGFEAPEHAVHWGLLLVSIAVVFAGMGLAYWMYVAVPDAPTRAANAARGLYQLSLNKFHVDELYDAFLLKPLAGVTQFARIFDQYVVDALVDLVGYVPRLLGALFRPVQNGLVQFYALAMVLGLTVFLIALVRSL
jgi:NADH-quinone oxidoreductase subunit L